MIKKPSMKKGMRSISKPSSKWKWQQACKSALAESFALENDVVEFPRYGMYCYFKNWFSLFRPQSCNSILRIRWCVHKALLLFSSRKKDLFLPDFLHPLYLFLQLFLHRDHRPSCGTGACQWPLETCHDIYVQGCSHKHNNYTHKWGLKLPFYENSNLDI